MQSSSTTWRPGGTLSSWQKTTSRYAHPSVPHSLWQVVNTLVPYLGLWYLMYRSLDVSYWLTLALAIPTGGFMVRTFIIFHDCGHGALFHSNLANAIVGIITGVLTFTPYYRWRHDHARHHATAGDLDRRGVGDVWTLTVKEYQGLPRLKRLAYRAFRNPFVMLGLGPMAIFVFTQRLPSGTGGRRERLSTYYTDLILLAIWLIMAFTIGLKAYILVQAPIIVIGGAVGVWLFYVQHQFLGVSWERHAQWNYVRAALRGASFYDLPGVLRWFTGSIGFHHIHHLNARIPNYNLKRCHEENPEFQGATRLTLRSSLACLYLRLWDEERYVLVGYGAAKS